RIGHGREQAVADDVGVALVNNGIADDASAGPADAALRRRGGDTVGVANRPNAQQGFAGAAPFEMKRVVVRAIVGAEARRSAAVFQPLHPGPEAPSFQALAAFPR